MDACGGCVSEIRLRATEPVDGLSRLQQHLPSSPYTFGALYTSLAALSSNSLAVAEPSVSDGVFASQPEIHSTSLLLLKAEFKWRFGGTQEQGASPPWVWMSERLCGPPPYHARDLNRFLAAGRPGRSPHLISPAYIVRLSFCDSSHQRSRHAAVDFLQTTSICKLAGWVAEEWYDVNTNVSSETSDSVRYVCMLSFDAIGSLDSAAAIVRECLSTATLHAPFLRWNLGVYKLEGSMACYKADLSAIEGPWSLKPPAVSKTASTKRARDFVSSPLNNEMALKKNKTDGDVNWTETVR